jgi:uncharacterized protein YbaR (Trm112 family)
LVHIEMIDLLRCVNAHEDTWLVASFREIANRIVVQGTLGCPVCGAQYEITDGVVDFTRGESITEYEAERAVASHRREELATRAGAYLDATQPGATIVLGGLWAYAAEDLANMADVRVIALDAPVPLAANSVHGIALDAWFRRAAVDEATRVTRPLSRIVGPTLLPPPDAAVVLAHDEQYWVAEKAAEMISLKRPRSEAGTTTSADRG